MCEGRDECKSEAEIRKWLRGKFIVLLYNRVRFIVDGFNEQTLIRESVLKYIPVSSQTRQIVPFEVTMMHLEMQDDMRMELGLITLREETGLFDLDEKTYMPYEKDDNVWLSVTVERNLDLVRNERYIYTFFAFLSDIGGLSGTLFIALSACSLFFNYNRFDDYMASRLFKVKKPPKEINPNQPYFLQSNYFTTNKLINCKNLVLAILPARCKSKCCALQRREAAL